MVVHHDAQVSLAIIGGAGSWAVNSMWEIWHFKLATKFTTRIYRTKAEGFREFSKH